MLDQVLEYLRVRPDGLYADVTAGLGGHTQAIAQRLTTGRVIATDRDAESLELARQRLKPWTDRVVFLQARFSELEATYQRLGICGRLAGLLADLGPSRYQLTCPERGFSFMFDGPLDMRMDRSGGPTAADLINKLSERQLAEILWRFGEERRAKRLARAIVRARPLLTTRQLAELVESVVPGTTGRLHPATRTFLALRLVVNEELAELEALLNALPRWMAPGGRVVIITFHSLEDRLVKRVFRALAASGKASLLTRKVVRPSQEEVRTNPASRSAKLRAIEFR